MVLTLALPAGCAPVAVASAPALHGVPRGAWRAERSAVVAQINTARAAARVPPLAYDPLLERVGDAHCAILIAEGGDGHFSRSGVPPYLRALLAGGNGFHRQNAAMFSSSAPVAPGEVAAVLARIVDSMLAETPPDDGHRRALLDPDVTHIGVGLAVRGGEVRMTHELATEAAVAWTPPPVAVRPRTGLVLAGRLAPPWRPVVAEVLWEALPRPIPDAELRAIRAYRYPPRRIAFQANKPLWPGPSQPGDAPSGETPFTVDRFGNFTVHWSAGPSEGVEIVVIAASDGRRRELVPVAASVTVVTATGALPADLVPWHALAGREVAARGDGP